MRKDTGSSPLGRYSIKRNPMRDFMYIVITDKLLWLMIQKSIKLMSLFKISKYKQKQISHLDRMGEKTRSKTDSKI
jgi:hypothetical protein